MTDRVKGLVVTLENDFRIDDIETIINAIQMIKGVANVEVSISTIDDQINRSKIKFELRDKFYNFMKEELM